MAKFRIKHDFKKHQPKWAGDYVRTFGKNNEGFVITAKSEEDAKEILKTKHNLNPYYITIVKENKMKKSELKDIIKDVIRGSVVAEAKSSITPDQIKRMKAEYSKIQRIDPSSPEYKKIISLLNSLDQVDLKKLADAKINFISRLALNRIKKNESITKDKDMITEAKAPTSSVYGIIGKYLWPDFLKTIKSKAGKLTWVDNRAISSSIFMAKFDGYTKSDVSFDGYVSMYVSKDTMEVTANWNDASKGGNEKKWSIRHVEDYSIAATEIGKFLKQWQGI